MTQEGNLGQSHFLGYPFCKLTPSIKDTFITGRYIPDIHLDGQIKRMAEYMIERSSGVFRVIEGSKWVDVLCEQIDCGRVMVVDVKTALRETFKPKNFLFLDNEEDVHGIGRDIVSTFLYAYPPNVITFRHVRTLGVHFYFLTGLAERVQAAAAASGLHFTVTAFNTYDEMVLGDLLYILVDEVGIVCKNMARVPTQKNYMSHLRTAWQATSLPPHSFIDDRYAVLVWNAFNCGELQRKIMLRLKSFDFYFVHGEEKVVSNSCFVHNPIVFWETGCSGSTRIAPVVYALMQYFGVRKIDKGKGEGNLDTVFMDIGSNVSSMTQEELKRKVREICLSFPEGSWTSFHYLSTGVKAAIQEMLHCNLQAMVILRDLRDVILANFNLAFGAVSRYGMGSDEEINGIFESILGNGSSNYASRAETFVSLRDEKNLTIIRFEDVVESPLRAYMGLVKDLGLEQDPYFSKELIEELVSGRLKHISSGIATSSPIPTDFVLQDLPRIVYGRPGGWKERFTEKHKKLYKENIDNGFLTAFGYEKDDNW